MKTKHITKTGKVKKNPTQKTIVTKSDIVDVKGMTIPKGTQLFIMKKPAEIKNPMSGKTEIWYVVKVDNGTRYEGNKIALDLMPETAFKMVK